MSVRQMHRIANRLSFFEPHSTYIIICYARRLVRKIRPATWLYYIGTYNNGWLLLIIII